MLQRVQIVRRGHPHFEEYGRFTGKIIQMKFGDGAKMAEVKLENCCHGTDACFVLASDVRQVKERTMKSNRDSEQPKPDETWNTCPLCWRKVEGFILDARPATSYSRMRPV